jgi:hypothetical protein
MSSSSDVVAGTNATAPQYNNLRTDAIKRDTVFVWEVEDAVPILNEQGGHYLVPEDMTIYKIGYKLDSGTATIRLQKGTTDIEAGIAVTDAYTEQTVGIDVTALTKGDKLSLDVTASSSGSGLIVMLYATRNL